MPGDPEPDVDVTFEQIAEQMPQLASLADHGDDIVRIEIPMPNAPEGTRLLVEVPRVIAPFLEDHLRPERIDAVIELMQAMTTLLESPR